MRTVFFYGEQAVAEGLPPAFLNVPHVIDEDGQPDLGISEYMLARRNGDWAGAKVPGGLHAEVTGRRVLRASLVYLRTRAYQLDSFRRWCRTEGLRTVAVTETELDRYGEDLEEGLVTGFEGGIRPQSVNQHLVSIIDYLQFATALGWRDKLDLTVNVRRGGPPGLFSDQSFAVMRRANPATLDIWYTEDEIGTFIQEFETPSGKLSAKIMYGTGLRIAEVLGLRVGDVPSIRDYEVDKAKRNLEVVGKFGKRRVFLGEKLLRDIVRYVEFDRLRYAARMSPPSDLLIVARTSGGRTAPMKARALQKEFMSARVAAKKSSLSPHLLRHHFAAHFLLRAWRGKQAALGFPAPHAALVQPVLSNELLMLKDALGHARFETTCGYLKAIGFLSGSEIPELYARSLDGE